MCEWEAWKAEYEEKAFGPDLLIFKDMRALSTGIAETTSGKFMTVPKERGHKVCCFQHPSFVLNKFGHGFL